MKRTGTLSGEGMRQWKVAQKLRSARESSDLSTREVARRLMPQHEVSHMMIARIEKGESKPSIELLTAMATIYGRPLTWFLDGKESFRDVNYFGVSPQVSTHVTQGFQQVAERWALAFRAIEQHLSCDEKKEYSICLKIENHSASELAQLVRNRMGLSERDPVLWVSDLIDAFGVRAFFVQSSAPVDGLRARFGEEAVIAINASVPADRARRSMLTEFCSFLLDSSPQGLHASGRNAFAFDFCSRVLLTDEMVSVAFKDKSFTSLVRCRQTYGVSMSELVFRGHLLGVVSDSEYSKIVNEYSKKCWSGSEPGHVRTDRPAKFEKMIDRAIFESSTSLSELAEIASVKEDELATRLEVAMGAPVDEPVIPNYDDDGDAAAREGKEGSSSWRRPALRIAH